MRNPFINFTFIYCLMTPCGRKIVHYLSINIGLCRTLENRITKIKHKTLEEKNVLFLDSKLRFSPIVYLFYCDIGNLKKGWRCQLLHWLVLHNYIQFDSWKAFDNLHIWGFWNLDFSFLELNVISLESKLLLYWL